MIQYFHILSQLAASVHLQSLDSSMSFDVQKTVLFRSSRFAPASLYFARQRRIALIAYGLQKLQHHQLARGAFSLLHSLPETHEQQLLPRLRQARH